MKIKTKKILFTIIIIVAGAIFINYEINSLKNLEGRLRDNFYPYLELRFPRPESSEFTFLQDKGAGLTSDQWIKETELKIKLQEMKNKHTQQHSNLLFKLWLTKFILVISIVVAIIFLLLLGLRKLNIQNIVSLEKDLK